MNQIIKQKLNGYPKTASTRLKVLRELIYQVAEEDQLGEVVENLKWGEPSYTVVSGSPIRIDWKEKHPESVSLYFHCSTKLVGTFQALYGDKLDLVGNREIRLDLRYPLPLEMIKHCIQLALNYHKIKSKPLLGC